MGSAVSIITCEICGNTHAYIDDDYKDKIRITGCDNCGYEKIENYRMDKVNKLVEAFEYGDKILITCSGDIIHRFLSDMPEPKEGEYGVFDTEEDNISGFRLKGVDVYFRDELYAYALD